MSIIWTNHAARRCLDRKLQAAAIAELVEQAAASGALPSAGTAVVTYAKTAVVVADGNRIVTLYPLNDRRWRNWTHGRSRGHSRRDQKRRAIEDSQEER